MGRRRSFDVYGAHQVHVRFSWVEACMESDEPSDGSIQTSAERYPAGRKREIAEFDFSHRPPERQVIERFAIGAYLHRA
jgi:hypothetical protein